MHAPPASAIESSHGNHYYWKTEYLAELSDDLLLSELHQLQTADEERVRATYGANLDRPADVKKKYDPDNLFRVNRNIPPAA